MDLEEREIDLRPYVLVFLQHWRIIILVSLGWACIAALTMVVRPQPYTATADTLVRPSQAQPNFDPRFPNVVDEQGNVSGGSKSREQALEALAKSLIIEERILDELPSEFFDGAYRPGSLANRFNVDVQGELIRISTRHTDAEAARTLADTWARGYVRLVNEIYNEQMLPSVERELAQSQKRYDDSQQALEDFLATTDLIALNRQIETLEGVLKDSQDANIALFHQHLVQGQTFNALRNDIATFRGQVAAGQSGYLANSLAALSLRTRLVGMGGAAGEEPAQDAPPFDLHIQFPDAVSRDQMSVDDVEALARLVEVQRTRWLTAAVELAQAVVAGAPGHMALPREQRNQYEQDLAKLYQQVEQENARKTLLTQQRDITLATLKTLQQKLDEQRVAQGFSDNQMVFIGTTVEPPQTLKPLVVRGGLGLVIGFLVSSCFVVGRYRIWPNLETWLAGAGATAAETEKNPEPNA
ncbi:MAG: hypothetical protein HC884_01375 [Chloroflexaceae bacterium]|nr:hypothetical protein [Chloroflexaceae bacterium]